MTFWSDWVSRNNQEFEHLAIADKIVTIRKLLARDHLSMNYNMSDHLAIIFPKTGRNMWVTQDYNGLIIDFDTMEIVCRPPPCIRDAPPEREYLVTASWKLDAFEAEIVASKVKAPTPTPHRVHVKDGTIVNLYWNNGRWIIGTLHGIDMQNVQWRGVTFSKLLSDTFARWNFDYDRLDKTQCYTFGFTHPAIHYTQTPDFWFVAHCTPNANTPHVWQSPFPEIAVQEPYNANDKIKWGVITHHDDGYRSVYFTPLMNALTRYEYHSYMDWSANRYGIDKKIYRFVVAALEPDGETHFVELWPETRALFARFDKEIRNVTQDLFKDIKSDVIRTYFLKQLDLMLKPMNRTVKDIYDFIKNPMHISTWAQHLELNGWFRQSASAPEASAPEASAS